MVLRNFIVFASTEINNVAIHTQFLLLVVVGYLWLDNKMNYQGQIEKHTQKVESLEIKVDKCLIQLKKSDSALAAATTKLEVLSTLGKIPK